MKDFYYYMEITNGTFEAANLMTGKNTDINDIDESEQYEQKEESE